VLTLTAGVQAAVATMSGSVALLGDSLHDVADALTALPLGVAFVLARRPPSARCTYAYGCAEDLAGIAVVLAIVASAGLVGCAGNELVARYGIRVGRRIGSAALVADGLHARSGSYTSLDLVAGSLRSVHRLTAAGG